MAVLEHIALTDDQQTQVWQGLIGSETRSLYFAQLVQRLRIRQRWLTVGSLVLSSGAALTLLASSVPTYNWAKGLLAVASAVLSAVSLVSANEKNAIESSDLHLRWNTLAISYRRLWNNMYDEEAVNRLDALQQEEASISKSSTAMPNVPSLVLKSERNVLMQYGITLA